MPDIKRPQAPQAYSDQPIEQPQMTQPPVQRKRGFMSKLIVIIVIIVVILVGLFLVSKYTSWNVLNVNKSAVSTSEWQAVFLNNGQVYFGQVASKNDEILVLREIYYLQVTEPIQPTPEGNQPQQNLSLVKLGNELHGPTDEMRINRDHILFTEDLKSDSRVVDAIVRYIEEGN